MYKWETSAATEKSTAFVQVQGKPASHSEILFLHFKLASQKDRKKALI